MFQYHAYSLSSFAGENIYVAFKNRNVEGDGVYIDLVSIGSQLGTSVTLSKQDDYNLAVYPNLFTTDASVFISLDHTSTVNVSIVDVTGKEVETLYNKYAVSGFAQGDVECCRIFSRSLFLQSDCERSGFNIQAYESGLSWCISVIAKSPARSGINSAIKQSASQGDCFSRERAGSQ